MTKILSKREAEILQLIAEGYKSTVIADMLVIDPRTIGSFKTRIKEKLGLALKSSDIALVAKAIDKDLVTTKTFINSYKKHEDKWM